MARVEFQDFSMNVKNFIESEAIKYLHEAGGELAGQTARNTRRGATGQTAGAWSYVVDEGSLEAQVGNPLENAIWEEFGKLLCRIKIGQKRLVVL